MKILSPERLKAIEDSWGPALSGGFKTPPAHIAMEQVLELVVRIRELESQVATLEIYREMYQEEAP